MSSSPVDSLGHPGSLLSGIPGSRKRADESPQQSAMIITDSHFDVVDVSVRAFVGGGRVSTA